MKLAVHALTAAAMAGTAAALGLWLDPWWIGVLVAVVVDGAWLLAGRMEATLTAAALDARRPRAVAWVVASLSAALLLAHALVEGSAGWAVVAVLPLVSRVLAWTADAMEQAQITPDAAEQIETLRQEARDRTAVHRAALMVEAEEERVRLETVSTETRSLATDRATAADSIAAAYEATQQARSLVEVPTGWTVAQLGTSVEVSTEPAEAFTSESEVYTPTVEPAPVEPESEVSPLVICGDHLVYTPAVPERPRLSTDEAKDQIRAAWTAGASLAEAARVSTRSRSYVQRVYAQLDSEAGPPPVPGQMALPAAA